MPDRLRFWLPLAACWASAVGALYLHPGLWGLFGLLLGLFVLWQARAPRSPQ